MRLVDTIIALKFRFAPRASIIESIVKLLETEIKCDSYGNEYVLLAENSVDFLSLHDEIDDKTAFEAVQNHVHILDAVTSSEYFSLKAISNKLCQIVFDILLCKYPNKRFYVYATASLHDSFIIRFHQAWEGELPYYDGCHSSENEIINCVHN